MQTCHASVGAHLHQCMLAVKYFHECVIINIEYTILDWLICVGYGSREASSSELLCVFTM